MQLEAGRGYDLIGDVHGCALTLRQLLDQLGYHYQGGVWRHPSRMALFLGDIVDRGNHIREALHLIHDMEEAGYAMSVMGNHEYDAIAWAVPAPPESGRDFVRVHSKRNKRIIGETLAQFSNYPNDWHDFQAWFYHMPLILYAGSFRVVHACWDPQLIDSLRARFADARIDRAFVTESAINNSLPQRILDRLLRGTGLRFPDGRTLVGSDGFVRSVFRTKFWEEKPETMGDVVFQPDALPEDIAKRPLEDHHREQLLYYDRQQPPLFVGHYWHSGAPAPIRPNLACMDYSAVLGGKLVAYRFDGEVQLSTDRFRWVEANPSDLPQRSGR